MSQPQHAIAPECNPHPTNEVPKTASQLPASPRNSSVLWSFASSHSDPSSLSKSGTQKFVVTARHPASVPTWPRVSLTSLLLPQYALPSGHRRHHSVPSSRMPHRRVNARQPLPSSRTVSVSRHIQLP